MFHVDIYLEASSWFLGNRKRWGAYVLAYERKNGELFTVEGFEKVEGTYNHVLLYMLNVALERVKKTSEIHIHSANSYILDMIDKNLPGWADHNFHNSRGQPVKDCEEWKKLWERKKEHILVTDRGLHEFSHWMMGEFMKKEEKGQIVDNSVDKAEKPHKYKCGKGVDNNDVSEGDKEEKKENPQTEHYAAEE